MSETWPLSSPFPSKDDVLVDKLLEREEDYRFDCKRLVGKLTTALETIVAFANSDGGFLVLGLEDTAKAKGRARVFGVDENPMAVDELRRNVESRITPSLLGVTWHSIGCTLRDGRDGSVLILRVPKSQHVHSIIGDGTFTRLGRSNKELVAAEINELSFARGEISAETRLESIELTLLDTPFWRAYANHRQLTRPLPEALEQLGLARKDDRGIRRATRAAVLLFAEDPSGLVASKASIRIFHYKGDQILHGPTPNLLKPPKTIGGPVIQQINETIKYVVDELATGVKIGLHGFDVVQRYPVRVLREAITNAVIHRDYHLPSDIHVRIFDDRIEIESPGLLPGKLTTATLLTERPFNRNPLLVNHLREFPEPPNLDAGEGIRMMFHTMDEAGLYTPLYLTRPHLERDAICVYLFNEARPSAWDQVSAHIDKHGTITNQELRAILRTEDTLRTSKLLRGWVKRGLLVVVNPEGAKRLRKYTKPETSPGLGLGLFSTPKRK
jgi:ATP-dependent DNA helicase RecG